MKLPVNYALPIAALILFNAVAVPSGIATASAKDRISREPVAPAQGPAADYPVIVGAPFTIAGTTWTPADQMNYDAVGYASVGTDGGPGITVAHKTLPLPSYAEVTALDTGRTVLVRIERRGPMVNDSLVELSEGAASQLGVALGAHAAIRIRRVNPPEAERALLRNGGRAPERMATPDGLLKVLRRKLAEQSPLLPPPSTPPQMPSALPAAAIAVPSKKLPGAAVGPLVSRQPPKTTTIAPSTRPPAAQPAAKPSSTVVSTTSLPPKPPAEASGRSAQFVQVGAFSVETNARKAAGEVGGTVSKAGKLWRVRIGPFAKEEQAAAALRKAQSAGYRDARIQRGE